MSNANTPNTDTTTDLVNQVNMIFINPFSVTLFGWVEKLLVDVRDNGIGKHNPKKILIAISEANQRMKQLTNEVAEITPELEAVRMALRPFRKVITNPAICDPIKQGIPKQLTKNLNLRLESLRVAIEAANRLIKQEQESLARRERFIDGLQDDLAKIKLRTSFAEFTTAFPELEVPIVTMNSDKQTIDAAKNFIELYWSWVKRARLKK